MKRGRLDALASMQLNQHIERLMEPTRLALNESPFHLCLPDEPEEPTR